MKESVNRVYKGAVLSSALFGGICLLLLVPSLLGSEGAVARESDPRETIRALSALGQKRVGTPACSQAGDWLAAKFRKIGLENVHFEPFRLPLQIVTGSTLALEVDGAARPFSHLALVGSGVGDVQAAPVWVNHAKPEDLRGKDLTHKIAVVRRDPNYDRAQQLFNVANARAAAMLYISDAPRGQIQVGSVLRTFEPTTRIPAVSISRNDGDAVEALIRQGRVRQVHMAVAATVSPLSRPAIGRNVVGTIPGVDPRHQIIFGAHYDTHLYGAVDNESGVAVLVGLAQQLVEFYRSSGRRPAYTLVFVGYDGEEIALYGGYSYLRHHYFMAHEAILAAINFEMPVGMNPRLDKEFPAFAGRKDWGIACSDVPVLKQVFAAARTNELYARTSTLNNYARDNQGLIGTDIQGHYRIGIPTATTDISIPFYHTPLDNLENMDADALSQAVKVFTRVAQELERHRVAEFEKRGPELWRMELVTPHRNPSAPLVVEARVTDGAGRPQANAVVEAELHVSDFFPVWTRSDLRTDARGRVRFEIPADALAQAADGRFLHLTAGQPYPMVEEIRSLDGL